MKSPNETKAERGEPKSEALRIARHRRFWAVYEREALVCVCVYLKGAREVIRRLQSQA